MYLETRLESVELDKAIAMFSLSVNMKFEATSLRRTWSCLGYSLGYSLRETRPDSLISVSLPARSGREQHPDMVTLVRWTYT